MQTAQPLCRAIVTRGADLHSHPVVCAPHSWDFRPAAGCPLSSAARASKRGPRKGHAAAHGAKVLGHGSSADATGVSRAAGRRPGRNVVIFGPSGAGKATIAGMLFAKRFADAKASAGGVRTFVGSHFSTSGWVTVNVYVVPWSHQRPRPGSSRGALLRVRDDVTVDINRLVLVLSGRLTSSIQEDLGELCWLDQLRASVAKARNFSTLLILNRCDDKVAIRETLLDELREDLELPDADGLCQPSFADVGPTERESSALAEAVLCGIEGQVCRV